MELKVAAVALVLVICRGSVVVLPSWTEPKSRVMGEMVRGDGVAMPRRLMKSSAVLASEVISRALIRVLIDVSVVGCGVKVTMRSQLARGEDGGAVALCGEVGCGAEGGDVDRDGAGVGEGDGLWLRSVADLRWWRR